MDLLKLMRHAYEAMIIRQEWTGKELEEENIIRFPVTANKDMAFHLAVYSGEEEPTKTFLARKLEMEEKDKDQVTQLHEVLWKNNVGNTPLHEAASVGNLAAVKLLVAFRKSDMLEKNMYGETPLYRAAKYGKLPVVEYFLDECEDYYTRSSLNWTNLTDEESLVVPIIHAAILSSNFEVVLKLVNFDKSLLKMEDSNHQTALYVLANMQYVYYVGDPTTLLERALYYLLPKWNIYEFNLCGYGSFHNNGEFESSSRGTKEFEDLEAGSSPPRRPSNRCIYFLPRVLECLFWRFVLQGWPKLKEMYKKKQKYELALIVTEMLAEIDYSWWQDTPSSEVSHNSLVHIDRRFPKRGKEEEYQMGNDDHHERALLLAAARGNIDVVTRIVKAHPQAMDYVTEQDRNILHVAIAHRQLNIFNWLQKQKLVMARLVKRIDKRGFTILHHVGITEFISQAAYGPALELQNELIWFERIHEVIPPLFAVHHHDTIGKPREYFDQTHKEMLDSGKEWVKKTSEACSAVAVLIATIVFAAAFTVPGGLNSKTGSPVLLDEPVYMLFTVMDIVALTTSLASVAMFLSILTSSFRMDDFRHVLPTKLSMGFQLLFISVASTMISFALATVLIMKSTEIKWAESFLYLATFFPISIFVLNHLPLYLALAKNLFSYHQILVKFLPTGFITSFFEVSKNFLCKKFA